LEACDAIALETSWRYSGGVDLLLFTTNRRWDSGTRIDFSGIINIPIHTLKETKLIESVDILFERIASFARNYRGPDPLLGFATQEVRVSVLFGIVESILSFIPREAKENLEYAKHFAIRNIVKNPSAQVRLELKSEHDEYPF
jgi:hypothetical protein